LYIYLAVSPDFSIPVRDEYNNIAKKSALLVDRTNSFVVTELNTIYIPVYIEAGSA
jgi:hypothetical protein